MQLELSDDTLAVRDAFASFFTNEAPASVARDAEPLGHDPALWAKLIDTGAPAMGVDAGGGAGLGDLVVVAEQFGRSIAPVPLVEHQVALRLLDSVGASHLVDELVAGTEVATITLRPAVDGVSRLVPAGAVADVVVGIDAGNLVVARTEAPGAAPANHACAPIADRALADGTVLTDGADAQTAMTRALDEYRTLVAAAEVGIAGAALDIALEYVMDRHQFGRPIGSFQAVQHGLADLPGTIDGARLLTAKAAWAAELGAPGVIDVDDCEVTDFSTLATMAFVFATDVARTATDRSLHYHGGYGFSDEYDIQLYYRRARGWSFVLDSPGGECRRLADQLFGEVA